jgi:nucleotide-binding universal stress UspA family protein
MRTVLAAIDNSAAARPVLTAARLLARLLDADVEAITVRIDGASTAHDLAAREHIPLRITSGVVVEQLVTAAAADDVAFVVLGARAVPAGRRPLGSTALAVATALRKPVLVVPPDVQVPQELRRVLIPLEGTWATSRATEPVIELAAGGSLDVIVLHVYDEETLPPFTDQPQHEQAARAEEFLARFCPSGLGAVRFESRVGRAPDLVLAVAAETAADVIALVWSQELASRAPTVRAVLAHAPVPVILIPIGVESAPEPTRRRQLMLA